jgi:DTW domain-containing protein YfiP
MYSTISEKEEKGTTRGLEERTSPIVALVQHSVGQYEFRKIKQNGKLMTSDIIEHIKTRHHARMAN